jgi:histidine triad (HIT) family protein
VGECVFCGIVAGTLPAWKVAENDRAVAFLTLGPLAEGHSLVVPRRHVTVLEELGADDLPALWTLVQEVSRRLRAAGFASGTNLVVASGRAAEQEVPHFHVHVVPRKEGDGIDLTGGWTSRVRTLPPERQSAIAARILGLTA